MLDWSCIGWLIRTFIMYHHKLSYKQRGYLLYMYKTTTKHTKYTQPRQRFGRCWMWHANKSHGNFDKLWIIWKNKKRRFLPASASITFANPSANTWRFHCLKSYLCLVRKQKRSGIPAKIGLTSSDWSARKPWASESLAPQICGV